MASTYAGVLGSLGMAIAMFRGAISGAGFEGTAAAALVSLLALSAVGFFVGWIAETTLDESVRQRLEQQLEAIEADNAA